MVNIFLKKSWVGEITMISGGDQGDCRPMEPTPTLVCYTVDE